jgi:hypothetical protein
MRRSPSDSIPFSKERVGIEEISAHESLTIYQCQNHGTATKAKPPHSSALASPRGTVVNADESGAWDNLHERFEMKRINHQEAYSLDGACTNQAEEYFSRLRRAEVGIHHHIAGA